MMRKFGPWIMVGAVMTLHAVAQNTFPSSGNVGNGTTSPAASLHVAGGLIMASDPNYNSINVQFSGTSIPILNFTRWTGTQSIQQNASVGQFFNATLGEYDFGIGTGMSTTGNQTTNTNVLMATLAGNVGIGTTAPGAKLEVDGNLKLTSGSGASITFPDGTVQSTAYTGVICGGDYAESVDVSGDRKHYEPGDVLVLTSNGNGDVAKSAEPYSTLVAGIYSTKPGTVGRRQMTAAKIAADEIPMAMVGIVPTKVSAENGPIHRGDLLVTSSSKGVAMKGTDRSRMLGAVIGKAMGSLESGTGVIEVLVTLQ